MYPYQLSKVLADERIHDLVTRSERYGRTATAHAAAATATAKQTQQSSPFSNVVSHLLARLHVRPTAREVSPTARDTSARTSTSAAGPMGCVA